MNATEISVGIIAFGISLLGILFYVVIFDSKEAADELMTHLLASVPALLIAFGITFIVLLACRTLVEGKETPEMTPELLGRINLLYLARNRVRTGLAGGGGPR